MTHQHLRGIYQLPNELLSHIFGHPDVPPESLFCLALVSHTFNAFFLPLYLARFGIFEPLARCELVFRDNPPHTLDALSGLRIATVFSLRVISALVVRFEGLGGGSGGDYGAVIRHMRRVHALVAGLDGVRTVKMVWGSERCGCCTLLKEDERLDEGLRAWSDAIGETLSVLVEKGCTALTVYGGKFMGHTYSLNSDSKHAEKSKKASSAFNFGIRSFLGKRRSAAHAVEGSEVMINVLRGEKWRFGLAKETCSVVVLTQLSPSAMVDPKIASLTIQSLLFVVPPVLHWTISTLRLPSMRSLNIMNIAISRKCWPAVFSLIADNAPHLTELRLSRIRQLVPGDLLHFLGRLPNLTILHLGRAVDCVDTYDLGPFPDFPRLVMLHAPAGWVFKLLLSQRKGLLRLELLTIVYNLRNDGLSHWLRRSSATSIPMLLAEQHRPPTVALMIHLGTNPMWRMLEDIEAARVVGNSADLDFPAFEPGAGLTDLDIVTSLKLVFDEMLDAESNDAPLLARVLPKWLALFFGLMHLAVTTQERVMSTAAATALVKGMLRQDGLAEISSVDVNGVRVYADAVDDDWKDGGDVDPGGLKS